MNNDKKGILSPFVKYLIESKQLEMIIEEKFNNLVTENNED